MTEIVLLRCPFCGGKAEVEAWRAGIGGFWGDARCCRVRCNAELGTAAHGRTEREAVRKAATRWNRRVKC
jgi:hypothetical protein